jgi:hypothetical protein
LLGPAMETVTGKPGEGIKPTIAELYNSFRAA